MAKYTMELRKVIDYYTREEVEKWFKSYEITDYLTQEQINVINKTGLWNKDKLAKKIVDHYFMREIGFETPFLFKYYAEMTMNELMEEKLPLIYSSSIQYDPLVNIDFTETFERSQNNEQKQNLKNEDTTIQNSSSTGTSNSNSNNKSDGLSLTSNTPETNIKKEDILNGKYVSSATGNESNSNIIDETTNNSSSEGTSNSNSSANNTITDKNNENYTKKIKGNSRCFRNCSKNDRTI